MQLQHDKRCCLLPKAKLSKGLDVITQSIQQQTITSTAWQIGIVQLQALQFKFPQILYYKGVFFSLWGRYESKKELSCRMAIVYQQLNLQALANLEKRYTITTFCYVRMIFQRGEFDKQSCKTAPPSQGTRYLLRDRSYSFCPFLIEGNLFNIPTIYYLFLVNNVLFSVKT